MRYVAVEDLENRFDRLVDIDVGFISEAVPDTNHEVALLPFPRGCVRFPALEIYAPDERGQLS